MACGILVPWAGIKPSPLALGAWNLKHGTASENPAIFLIVSWLVCSFFVPLFLLCWFPSWFDTFLCMHAKLLPLCPTLCHPMDCSSPGSSVHGILQVRITGVGCHVFLQGISPTQGSNPGSLISTWLASRFFTTSNTWEAYFLVVVCFELFVFLFCVSPIGFCFMGTMLLLLLSCFSRVWLCVTP